MIQSAAVSVVHSESGSVLGGRSGSGKGTHGRQQQGLSHESEIPGHNRGCFLASTNAH